MKIVLLEPDADRRARAAHTFSRSPFRRATVLTELPAEPLTSGDVIVVDPGTEACGSWLVRLRERHPEPYIVITTYRTDVLAMPVRKDKRCAAITRPHLMVELADVVECFMTGQWYEQKSAS